MRVCPDCGSRITYFVDDDNSNYNEYICENYNSANIFNDFKKCWWRESSARPAIERDEFYKRQEGKR